MHPDVSVERLAPISRLKRHQLPRWSIRFNGEIIGRVEAVHMGGARNTFYFAWGIHPETGKEIRLEGDTDFEDRVDVVRRFHINPGEFERHLPLGTNRP